jgi:hypothetical protein
MPRLSRSYALVLAAFIIATFFIMLMFLSLWAPYTTDESLRKMSVKRQKYKISTFLAIVVLSSPGNRILRDAVRQTWLTYAPDDVHPFFVVGALGISNTSALNAEVLEYGDLVLLSNLADSYVNLTRKLVASFAWLVDNVYRIHAVEHNRIQRPLLETIRSNPCFLIDQGIWPPSQGKRSA